MSHINGNDQQGALTDADINLLYDVVLLAAQKPDPPFGPGLFSAYDEIIRRENVGVEESGKYFSFVCRMVAGKMPGQTVYERFEAMLQEMGIEVSPEESQDGAADQTEEPGRAEENGQVNGKRAENGVINGNGTKVNGTNGYHYETTQETRDGAQFPVQPVMDGTTNSALLQPPRRRNGQLNRRSRSQDTQPKPLLEVVDTRGRLKMRASSDNLGPQRGRAISTSVNPSLRIAMRNESIFPTGDAYSADESELSITRSRRLSFMSGVNPAQDAYIFLPSGLFQRSDEEMEEDAEAFQHSKACIAQRRILWEWRNKAVDMHRESSRNELIANDFDQGHLLTQVLEVWRERTAERQREREVSLWFSLHEARAIEMRNMMLKEKALTHWLVVTEENREKTSIARRQILRGRYFTAWKSITVAQDTKVRLHVLSKFFRKWQRRADELEDADFRAVARHEANSKRRMWVRLVLQHREKNAVALFALQRKEKYFQLWREKVRLVQERDQHVSQMRQRLLQRKILSILVGRQLEDGAMEANATEYNTKKLLAQNFASWRTAAQLQPLVAQVSQRIDQRVLHTALSVWNRNAQMSRQATRVHDSRITRNAFTNWNDALRIRYLEIRIVARLRAETFYKWIFAVRETVATRERDIKIATSCLSQWAAKAQVRQRALDNASRAFASSQRQIRLRGALTSLVSTFRSQKQLEANAMTIRNQRLELQALSLLRIQNASIQEMNGKAAAARFYILTTSTLRNLKTATYHHQQIRRREIYAQVRRRTKMSLAREMLRRMQDRLAHIRAMEHTAAEKEEDRVMGVVVHELGIWKRKTDALVALRRQATAMEKDRLFGQALNNLRERHAQLEELDLSARSFSSGLAAVQAITALRKMRIELVRASQRDAGARDLRDMHWQKHVKNMLRYWAARSLALQQGRLKRSDVHERGHSPEDDDFDDERVEEDAPRNRGLGDLTVYETSAWNLGNLELDLGGFDEGDNAVDFAAEGVFTSTPLPGYLRTPSKRSTARAKARLQNLVAGATAGGAAPPGSALRVPMSAPSRQQTSSAPPAFAGTRGGITPFERKLREQGYPERPVGTRTPLGTRTPGGPSGSGGMAFGSSAGFGSGLARSGLRGRLGGGLAKTPARGGNVGFVGFEDITEGSEPERSIR